MSLLSKLLLKSRLELVYAVVDALIRRSFRGHEHLFLGYASALNTIRIGIERQYLREVAFLLCKGDKIIYMLRIWIDWERHQVCSSVGPKTFEFDSAIPIVEQIAMAATPVSDFINRVAAKGEVDAIKVLYWQVPNADKVRVDSELGISSLSVAASSEFGSFMENSVGLEVVPERVSEVHIEARSRKKGS